MKTLLKWIAIGMGALVLIVLVGGFLMPRTIEVSRETVINGSPDKIFAHVADLRAFNKWSPWSAMDPDMKVTYSGPETGVGQKSSWESEKMGNGSQTIVELAQNEKVVTDLDFGPMGTAQAQFLLAPQADGTKVTWSLNSDLGNNPLARWFGPMLRSGVSKDYESGLATLKQLVEAE